MKKIIIIALLFFVEFLNAQNNFHDTQGKLDISNSGQASYTIPIALPPSIQSVGPTINLVYTSGQFGGVIGQGWNINSISTISRMASSISVDGFIDGVDFDIDDKLALDGQRLLVLSGNTYWADGSKYQTEIQSNTKIELKGTGSGIYFIVTNPDGSRSWYGNYLGAIASDLTNYYITRFEDNKGNYITYNYYKPFSKSLCIKDIKFSANTNSHSSLNTVIFYYKLAKRTEFSYVKGLKHEKEALLSGVEVKTNNLIFRKYEISHSFDVQLGYEKVSQIQEFNGAGEATNPVQFSYNDTQTVIAGSQKTKSYANNLPTDSKIPGDYDGDGRLDFLSNYGIYTNLFQENSGQTPIDASILKTFGTWPITTLKNNKLVQKQSLLNMELPELNQLSFKVYNLTNSSSPTLEYNYFKTIVFPNAASCYSDCPWKPCVDPFYIKTGNKFLEGDFNGDGISEMLLVGYPEQRTNLYEPASSNINTVERIPDPNEDCIETITLGIAPDVIRILDLNPNSSTTLGTKGYVDLLGSQSAFFGKFYVMDFNGDGKTDVLSVREDKSYTVSGFKQLNTAPWIQMEMLGQGIMPDYEKDKIILFGDFNGDSKVDIIIPVEELSSDWKIYFSNPNPAGGEFFVTETHTIVNFRPSNISDITDVRYKSYYAIDSNKDGKSDLMQIEIRKFKPADLFDPNDRNTDWKIKTFVNNLGNSLSTATKFPLDYQTPCTEILNIEYCNLSGSPSIPVVIASEFRNQGVNNEVVVLNNHYNTLTYVDFTKNVTDDNMLIQTIETGTGNTFQIDYEEMSPPVGAIGLSSDLSNFYSHSDFLTTLNYPNIELIRLPQYKLVSKLTNTVLGVKKYQDYKYHGFVINMIGLGSFGFEKVARSGWYLPDSTEKRIWSVGENNPLFRNSTTRTYTQLLNSTDIFTFSSTVGIINSMDNEYNLLNSIPYSLVLHKKTAYDYLTNIKIETQNTYSTDGYFIPEIVTTKNYLGSTLQGTKTVTTGYTNNPSGIGNSFFIGRPSNIVTLTNAYSTTFSTKEKFTYTGNKLTKLEKKGNSTLENYVIEDYEYFTNGNLKKKTLSATAGVVPAIVPRIIEQSYDPTGRFVLVSKDVEGLLTTNTYHPLYGSLLTTKNPYGIITLTNEYDNWGKLLKTTDYFGKKIVYGYLKENNTYKLTITGDDGSQSFKTTDLLNRVIKTGQKNIDNSWSFKDITYDYLGRKFKESEPYSGTSTSLYTYPLYDDYGRLKQTNYPSGLVATIAYTGLTVTAYDGTKTIITTKNANGHLVSSTDPGGTIVYQYYANGNLKVSNFDGVQQQLDYDDFGRKKTLIDPSAGTYTYKYNFLGEVIEETTPKGKTTFGYNNFGKLIQKKIEGLTVSEATNITTTYTYDATTKLLNSMNVVNTFDGNSSYTYEYDSPLKRLWKTTETTPLASYRKEITFDTFGREEKVLYYGKELSTSKSSSKQVRNIYYNGSLKQIVDQVTGQSLWLNTSVNARGQLTSGQYGNGIDEQMSYDNFGFPNIIGGSKTTTSSVNNGGIIEDVTTTQSIYNLTYNFNPQRGLLNFRNSSLVDINETFEYDTLDRLIKWSSPSTVLHNLLFTGTVDGFIATTGAAVASVTGKLRITATPGGAGAKKLIIANATLGTKLNIAATINKSTTNQIRVTIIEQDPSTGLSIENVLGFANEGAFIANYTIGTYKNVFLKFDKSPTSTDVGVSKVFLVDNVIVSQINQSEQLYDNKGRISQSDVGNYSYENSSIPYQNSKVALTPAAIEHYTLHPLQEVTYNAFKSPIRIYEQNYDKIDFSYNTFQNRSSMFYGGLQDDKLLRTNRKHYAADGSMEIKHNIQTQAVEFITYIGGDAYSAPVIFKSNGALLQEFLYLHRDYLGSIVAITNQAGTIVEKRHFDAWGNVTKVQDGSGTNLQGLTIIDRGYTGHEHLQSVGLIHMNGRLYDPKVHRFLQPDNFIQDTSNTQNYNRYGYVLNNPLKYTDPSGEIIEFSFLTVLYIAAALSAAFYLTDAHMNGPITLRGFLTATFIGALSGAATFGIGTGAGAITGNLFLKASIQAVAHGIFQGGMNQISAGDFWSGFASGAVASLASTAFQGGNSYGSNYNNNYVGLNGLIDGGDIGTVVFGAISGGAAAELSGGNFVMGAWRGAMVAAFNHLAHEMGDENYGNLEEQIVPQSNEGIKTVPNPSDMDPDYRVKGKQWKMISGRKTIVNSKGEILQWDSKKGEVELYKNKQHLGGYDPYDRNRQITKPDGNRTPNGGWKMSSHKFFNIVNRLIVVPLLFLPDAVRLQTNQYQQENIKG